MKKKYKPKKNVADRTLKQRKAWLEHIDFLENRHDDYSNYRGDSDIDRQEDIDHLLGLN